MVVDNENLYSVDEIAEGIGKVPSYTLDSAIERHHKESPQCLSRMLRVYNIRDTENMECRIYYYDCPDCHKTILQSESPISPRTGQ